MPLPRRHPVMLEDRRQAIRDLLSESWSPTSSSELVYEKTITLKNLPHECIKTSKTEDSVDGVLSSTGHQTHLRTSSRRRNRIRRQVKKQQMTDPAAPPEQQETTLHRETALSLREHLSNFDLASIRDKIGHDAFNKLFPREVVNAELAGSSLSTNKNRTSTLPITQKGTQFSARVHVR